MSLSDYLIIAGVLCLVACAVWASVKRHKEGKGCCGCCACCEKNCKKK